VGGAGSIVWSDDGGAVATLFGGATVGAFFTGMFAELLMIGAGRETFDSSGGGITAAAEGAGSDSSLYAASSAAGASCSYSR
jgi:hypothetical protein